MILSEPTSKEEWKIITSIVIQDYWNAEIAYDAKSKSSLKHLNISNLQIGQHHQVWTSLPTNPRETEKANIKSILGN